MAVSLEARDVAIFRVDQIHRLALLGSKEELPVAGCRLPLSPEGGHGQGGVGLHDPGERPIIGAAFDMPARGPQPIPEAELGCAHVCTPVTNAHLVYRLL